MTRTTRVLVAMAIALTLMMGAGREAFADALKCKEGIAKQAAAYVQKRSKALQKCEDAKTKGKLPATQVCTSEPKTQSALGVLATKLGLGIASACGGADKTCGTADDDSLASIGWGSTANCPGYGDIINCTQAIASCSDIATCIQCSADAAVGQLIGLYYASLDQTAFATGNAVNKCQGAIGKATAKFLGAKSKALQKCWNVQLAAGTSNPCPDATTTSAIGLAEQKKVASICKACGGPDKLCDGTGDLTPSAVGFVASCPAVTPPEPGHTSCARPIATASDLVACVDCVTEAAVDCLDALAVPEFVSPLPAACNPTTCGAIGSACINNADCCSNNCVVVAGKGSCQAGGSTTTTTSSTTTTTQPSCGANGSACTQNSQCCSANCVFQGFNGTCQGQATTTTTSSTTTSTQPSCGASGSACSTPAQCCSNNCFVSGGVGICCIATGSTSACTVNTDCCSNNCVFQQGNGHCQDQATTTTTSSTTTTTQPSCGATGSPCTQNSQCCSNNCNFIGQQCL